MKIIHKGFTFRLLPDKKTENLFRQFAGCCRLIWNLALEKEKTALDKGTKFLGYHALCDQLMVWKGKKESEEEAKVFPFLADVHSQVLQQRLKDLDQAVKRFRESETVGFPKFKRRGRDDSFRYPQGFKLDEGNSCIYLPKIGWVRYKKSRDIQGTPKNVTVSLEADHWYVSIIAEIEIPDPVHPSQEAVGLDAGVVRLLTLSDGSFIVPIDALRKYEEKIASLQQELSRKEKGSSNYKKVQARIAKIYDKVANTRKDYLHKVTTEISRKFGIVVIENLLVRNMTRSAKGTVEEPGHNVKAKSGLNKAILDQGWYELRRQLAYKLDWLGGKLIVVPPQYTSQTCSRCGHKDKNNRPTQEQFKCTSCGFELNADHNAALNILAAGRAVITDGSGELSLPREAGTTQGCNR